jgi:hypothetical protein
MKAKPPEHTDKLTKHAPDLLGPAREEFDRVKCLPADNPKN